MFHILVLILLVALLILCYLIYKQCNKTTLYIQNENSATQNTINEEFSKINSKLSYDMEQNKSVYNNTIKQLKNILLLNNQPVTKMSSPNNYSDSDLNNNEHPENIEQSDRKVMRSKSKNHRRNKKNNKKTRKHSDDNSHTSDLETISSSSSSDSDDDPILKGLKNLNMDNITGLANMFGLTKNAGGDNGNTDKINAMGGIAKMFGVNPTLVSTVMNFATSSKNPNNLTERVNRDDFSDDMPPYDNYNNNTNNTNTNTNTNNTNSNTANNKDNIKVIESVEFGEINNDIEKQYTTKDEVYEINNNEIPEIVQPLSQPLSQPQDEQLIVQPNERTENNQPIIETNKVEISVPFKLKHIDDYYLEDLKKMAKDINIKTLDNNKKQLKKEELYKKIKNYYLSN